MCPSKPQTTSMQYLSKEFWSKGSPEKAFSNGSWKQEEIQMWFVWVFSFWTQAPYNAKWMCPSKPQTTSMQHTFVTSILAAEELLRIIFKWFMKTRRNSNVICVNIQLLNAWAWLAKWICPFKPQTTSMQHTFVTRILAAKELLRIIFKWFTKTRRNKIVNIHRE